MRKDDEVLQTLEFRCGPLYQPQQNVSDKYDAQTFQHEGSPSILFQKLTGQKGDDDLQKGQLDIGPGRVTSRGASHHWEDGLSEREGGAAA